MAKAKQALQNAKKRYKNTHCLFDLSVKVFKEIPSDKLPCITYIEHAHNHPMKLLQNLSFKSIPDLVISSIRQLLEKNMTPSMAYYEYVQQLRTEVSSDLEFHMKKADCPICPRRRDINSLYKEIMRKNLEGKTETKCLTSLRGPSASTGRNIPVVNCRISNLTQKDQSPLLFSHR